MMTIPAVAVYFSAGPTRLLTAIQWMINDKINKWSPVTVKNAGSTCFFFFYQM